MKKGNEAYALVGMPKCHGNKFSDAATQHNTIIMSRAPGIYATQLIEEGYASKGFHNKAKSCNWGPMAGFVNVNPMFSKAGLTEKGNKSQTKSISKARKSGAKTTPLIISGARINRLKEMNIITEVSSDDKLLKLFKKVHDTQGITGITANCIKVKPTFNGAKGDTKFLNLAKKYSFYLKEHFQRTSPLSSTWERVGLWEVYYSYDLNLDLKNGIVPPFKKLYSFVDPNFSEENTYDYDNISNHLYSTTADFDLFAAWGDVSKERALIKIYRENNKTMEADSLETQIKKMDMRPASTLMLRSYYATEEFEDSHLGNITPRLSTIMNDLNQKFKTGCNYTMGNLVHHSDEAGRPKIDDVDMPVIVFFPRGSKIASLYGADVITVDGGTGVTKTDQYNNVKKEFKLLIQRGAANGYQVNLNPGWANELNNSESEQSKKIYTQYVLPSDPKANPFSQQNIKKYQENNS